MQNPELAEANQPSLNDIVVVTGVSASGKDYLLERVMNRLDTDDRMYEEFSFGTMIHDIIRREYPGIYDGPLGLRGAPEDKMDAASDEALETILATNGLKIVNCHVAYRGAESIQINPYHTRINFKTFATSQLVFVTANPSVLF